MKKNTNRLYTEGISKKDLLRLMEAPIDYEGPERMAGDVERKITGKETPYHGFPAIPNMDRDFIELISSKRFKDSVDKVRTAMGDTRTIQGSNALMRLMGTVGQAMQKLVMIQNQNKKLQEEKLLQMGTRKVETLTVKAHQLRSLRLLSRLNFTLFNNTSGRVI